MVKITYVADGSRAKKAGIAAEDILISINGNEINDVLDYRFYLADTLINLELMRGESVYTTKIIKSQ